MFDRRRGAPVARATGDAGVSLVELVVSMTIMTVVLAVFTGAAVQMFHSTSDTETIAAAQSQVNVTFLRLDKEIRYAAGISAPDTSNVEYLRTDEGTLTCTRLWCDGVNQEL
jgi:type II secretory pathway component PulJ